MELKLLKKLEKFEKLNNFDRTPIIIITGNYTKFDRLKSVKLEYDDFLCKPLDKDIIL